jgi:SAM-dependent methyltransferase
MHDNSMRVFRKYAKPYFKSGTRVLEIGPDKIPSSLQQEIGDDTITWEHLDLASYQYAEGILDHAADDEYSFPLQDDSFDVVLAANVIEHVRKIWVWFPEVARVCRPGGTVIVINPITVPHHPYPIDCWRIYPDGIRALHEESGLRTELAEFDALEPSWRTPLHLMNQTVRWFLRKPICVARPIFDTIGIGVKA